MKPTKNIEKLIKDVELDTNAERDKAVLEDVLNALEESKKKKPAVIAPNIWRTIMKSRITKLAAAAGIIVAVIIGVHKFGGSIGGTTPVYGITDVPKLLKEARTLHVESTAWVYKAKSELPEFEEATIIPTEYWVDLPNLREYFTSYETYSKPNGEVGLRKLEGVRDGGYAVDVDHTRKIGWYNKLSLVKQKLAIRDSIDSQLRRISEEQLDLFVKVGQETINGKTFDIWQREEAQGREGRLPKRIRCWISPVTGELRRIYTWRKNKASDGNWRPMCFVEKIECDIDIPDKIFEFSPPPAYKYQNSKETASLAEGLGAGFFTMAGARVSIAISFTLDDGSAIVAWHSDNLQNGCYQSQEHLFKNLQQGGELPKLPMVIHGLKKKYPPPTSQSDVQYVGRHLTFTKKSRWWYEWAIYVPKERVHTTDQKGFYQTLCRFNLSGEQRPQVGNPIPENRIDKDEFDTLVRGAMAELSDDGKAPEDMTYEAVLKIAKQTRKSLVE